MGGEHNTVHLVIGRRASKAGRDMSKREVARRLMDLLRSEARPPNDQLLKVRSRACRMAPACLCRPMRAGRCGPRSPGGAETCEIRLRRASARWCRPASRIALPRGL